MSYRVGRLLYRLRWPLVAVWILVISLALPTAPRVFQVLAAGGFTSPDLEAQRAGDLLNDRFAYNPASLYVVFEDPTRALTALDPRFQAQVLAAIEPLRALPDVAFITTPYEDAGMIAPDGYTAYATVALRSVPEDFRDTLPTIELALVQPDTLRMVLTGSPVFYSDIQEVTENDLRRAEIISFPFAALALLLVFGSVMAAALPALVGGAAVVVTLASMVLLTQVTPLSIFALNLATMLGLGLGIDYSLFIVSRFREELASGRNVPDAVAWSVATAGRAVLFSGLTVFVGLLGLLLFDFNALRSLGIAGSIVVAVCMLAALTFLPPVLGILGPRVDLLSIGALWRRVRGKPAKATLPPHLAGSVRPAAEISVPPVAETESQQNTAHVHLASTPATPTDPASSVGETAPGALSAPSHGPPSGGAWYRLAHWVMAHPLLTLLPVLTLLVALGLPFLRVQFGAPDASILPGHVQSRQGFDLLRERWGQGELAPVLVVLRAEDGGSPLRPEYVGAAYDFVQRLQADPRVERVESIVSLDPRLTRAQYQALYAASASGVVPDPFAMSAAEASVRADTLVVRVTSRYGQTDDRSKALVYSIRATPSPARFEMLVGGGTAGVVDYADRLYADFPRTALFVFAATLVLLLVTFGSVVLPLKAVFMNLLSLTASYGALVVVFQEGALSGLLGFQPLGFVEASLPIVMFCVLFGLSMDYEVFLLSRVKEAYDAGEDNRTSVALGLERSGRIITSAAGIVVLVSFSFVAADIVLIKALGLGTAIAVFLDATAVRALVVPATMRLMGDWNWYAPAWLRRILPTGSLHAS